MMPRDPKETRVYLVGAGIASLAAAVHLIADFDVPPGSIHIFDSAGTAGGCLVSSRERSEQDGYIIKAARKIRGSYCCLEEMLKRIPSPETRVEKRDDEEWEQVEEAKVAEAPSQPQETLADYLRKLSEVKTQKITSDTPIIRMSATTPSGPEPILLTSLSLSPTHQVSLTRFVMSPESNFAHSEVQEHFDPSFFETVFWDLWSSTYVFHPWHGAVEFRRYLRRFLEDVPGLASGRGLGGGAGNEGLEIVGPVVEWLREKGVDFVMGTTVDNVRFVTDGDKFYASEVITTQKQSDDNNLPISKSYSLLYTDILLVTLGSVASGITAGTNTSPPSLPSTSDPLNYYGPAWSLWSRLISSCPDPSSLGNPLAFCTDTSRSSWFAFTTTFCQDTRFFDKVLEYTGGSCPLLTFRDCPWMLSISLPKQLYFKEQHPDTRVMWGYGLFPDQLGIFVKKSMDHCSGGELLTEVLGHMGITGSLASSILSSAITIPVMMPLTGAPLLAKEEGDRPKVVPDSSGNLGLLGQFVEMERDVAFTMEYSVRSAQEAIRGLMGGGWGPPEVPGGDPSAVVLGEFMKAMMT